MPFASVDKRVNEQQIVVGKTLSGLLLGYLAYTMIFCPCKPYLYSCHLSNIYGTFVALVLVVVFFNGAHIQSYTPVPH